MTLAEGATYLLNNRIEAIATVLGIVNIILLIRQNIWNFPVGIVMVSLFGWVVWEARLYSDFGLQIFFLCLQFYGWFNWARGRSVEHDPLPVTVLSTALRLKWIGVAAVGIAVLGAVMDLHTDAALPYWDATTTVLSVIAQYFLARKLLENWMLWIAVDVLAIGIYASKGLYIFSSLYGFFLVLATLGLVAWARSMRSPQAIQKHGAGVRQI